jgi:hypothetical protein
MKKTTYSPSLLRLLCEGATKTAPSSNVDCLAEASHPQPLKIRQGASEKFLREDGEEKEPDLPEGYVHICAAVTAMLECAASRAEARARELRELCRRAPDLEILGSSQLLRS